MYRLAILYALLSSCFAATLPPRADERIVGGTTTEIEFQISLRYLDLHICGGAIISSSAVVTAGHCIYSTASKYSVQHSNTKLGFKNNVIQARQLLRPACYNTQTRDCDIAIVKLAKHIIFGLSAQPIALASARPSAGTRATVSGWGAIRENGAPRVKTLHKVDVSIVAQNTCVANYKGHIDITARMICAGVQNGGKDACQGDSGGPLMAGGKLVGIVSGGIGCGRAHYPGVYTNVAAFKEWIHDII